MQCTKCGQELPERAGFCPYCGEKAAGGNQEADKPIYLADVKGWLKSGKLAVYCDRVEFSTSSVQKIVFHYDSLVSVKKRLLPTPAILFITEDGRTESCAATSKNIHEAFLYVEQAVKPYIEARKKRLLAQGIRYSLVSSMGMANSGILNISDNKAEFLSKSGQKETVPFQDVKSAGVSAGTLDFFLFNGGTKSFSLDKELREEVLDFVKQAIKPYLEERKEALLAKGIYYSFFSILGQERGTIDILADRVEFTGNSGRTDSVDFKDVRTVSLYEGMLELSLTYGITKSFAADREEQEEILAFIRKAIEPYVEKRTVGFETVFGSDERIEINQERGVFHIIRRNGAVITDECSLGNIIKCQQVESTELNPMITGIRLGSKAIANKAAGAVGKQGAGKEGETIRSIDILLTIQTETDQQVETVRFGDFPLGISRENPKYAQYTGEAAGLMDYLGENCPKCQLIVPVLPVPEPAAEGLPELKSASEELPEETAGADSALPEESVPSEIQKYITGIAKYITTCKPPMTIAFQGTSGSGENNRMKLLADSLEERYKGNLIWFHGKQLFRFNLGEKLPMLIGAALVSQLGGANDGRVVKFAKAFINLAIALMTQGNLDGQILIDALFKDAPSNSLEDLAKTFSELVEKKSKGEKDKVIIFVDGLDAVAPAKVVEGLEAMEDFFDCAGCVFVVAVEYASVIRGMNEKYGQEDENRGKSFFNKTFRISFRLPEAGFQMENYVKNRLKHIELAADDEELGLYCKLLTRSVGDEPESLDHLFESFQMLRALAGEDIYESKSRRLILFGLLCMQTRFRTVYSQLVQIKEAVTPELLLGLCGTESDVVLRSQLAEEEQADFRRFARVFCGIINADNMGGISRSESSVFTQVLEFSSITLK